MTIPLMNNKLCVMRVAGLALCFISFGPYSYAREACMLPCIRKLRSEKFTSWTYSTNWQWQELNLDFLDHLVSPLPSPMLPFSVRIRLQGQQRVKGGPWQEIREKLPTDSL